MIDETTLSPLRATEGCEGGFALGYAIQLRTLALPTMCHLATTGQFCDALVLVLILHDTAAWWIKNAKQGSIEQLHLVLQRECRQWMALRHRARLERGPVRSPLPSEERGTAEEGSVQP